VFFYVCTFRLLKDEGTENFFIFILITKRGTKYRIAYSHVYTSRAPLFSII